MFTGDNAVGIVNAPPHLSSEIYKDIVLQKSGLSQLKYDDNLDFIHNYYNIFTYLNQNIIHKIIKEISQNLFINLNSENVNLLDAPLKNVEGFVKSFVDVSQNSKKYIPNNFLQGFLNYFFSKNTYDNSKYLYNLKDNLSEIPEEEFSPQFYDSLVLKFIENNYYHKRFKDFDGDLLEYVSLYETEGTNLNQYKLSDDQIKELKRIYDENAKELTLPKALLINISVILLTRGVDLSGDFAKKINNSSLLDKITKSMLESSNEDSKDIENTLKEYSSLVSPYFLSMIVEALKLKDFEELKSLPLETKLVMILDSDNPTLAQEYIDKFDRQYRNLHKNSKEYFTVLCFVITYTNLFGISSNLIISGVNNNITKDGNFDNIDQETESFAFLLLIFGKNIDSWLRKFNNPHDAAIGFTQNFRWPRSEKSFGDYLLKATMGYKNLSSFPSKDIGIIQKFWSELTEDEKKLTAYHEGGHAIVALNEKASDPIHKATIIPRGRALGMVMQLPEKDQISQTREQLHAQLAIAMGGRVAEEIIFGEDKVTTGASSDIEQATQRARAMVMQAGLSKELGPVAYGSNEEEVFLGRSVARTQNMSEETSRKVDSEIRKIVDRITSNLTFYKFLSLYKNSILLSK